MYYDKDQLKSRVKKLDLTTMQKRYEEDQKRREKERLARIEAGENVPEGVDDFISEEEMSEAEEIPGFDDDVRKRQLLPSTSDPKIWQVRVKKNQEKIAAMALLNKASDFARKGKPLSILSATASDATEGWIFVEAFKEVHVRQACSDLHFCLNKYLMLPTEQMTDVFANDAAKNNELNRHQWVRIKNGSAYNGDIGLVERVDDSKVYVRLIPRVDLSGANSKGPKRFIRIPQRINFQPTMEQGAVRQVHKHIVLNKYMTQYKNMLLYRGFLFKAFPFKQVDTNANIKPTHEELQNFQLTVSKNSSGGQDDDLDDDDYKTEQVILKALRQGGTAVYAKGDKIRINKGDLTGIRGTVIAIEEGEIMTFKAIDYPQLDKPL